MSIVTIKEIKSWWGNHVNTQPAWRVEDLPSPEYKAILLSLHLAYEIRRDVIVLGKPDTSIHTLMHSYFWEIVSSILAPYQPYVITGIAAIHLHLQDESLPKVVEILTPTSSTKINLLETYSLAIEKNPEFFLFQEKTIVSMKTQRNYTFYIESPESLLVRLRPQYLRDYPQLISVFLKAISFNFEILGEFLLKKSKPITYLRLAGLFTQVGKKQEAKLFNDYVKAATKYNLSGKKQIIKHSLPASIANPKRLSDATYIIRFRDQLRIYKDKIDRCFKKIKTPRCNLEQILTYAEQTKKYDTYHSSTIEGYRVTPEEIQALIDGKEINLIGKPYQEIENKIALKGYLQAYQFVLQEIRNNFENNFSLTQSIIREIYANLFFPSVEAGLLTKDHLIQYRNDAVFIRNARHIPPNYQKIDDLMQCLIEEVNVTTQPITQALISHYGFVTIHPYFDGNGRVGRLLMNYLLCRSGIPWVTIRAEEREIYFRALEVAQCDEDIIPFANFMKQYFDSAMMIKIIQN